MSQISDACGGGDGRALVAGSLRGYRTWRLQRRPRAGALPLTSVTRRVVWTPTLTARCTPDPTAVPGPGSSTPADDDHPAPAPGCRCGVYGWYDPTDTGIVHARVFGVVEASGLVLMGDRGFRAERATVAAVVSRNRRLTAACARAGIAVYRRRRDLVRDYPPEDLSSLLGDPRDRPPDALSTPVPSPPGLDRLVLLVLCGRVALIAAALAVLPTAPAVVTAALAHVALLGLVATRLRH
ncbi:MAG TPA: hypothetical protein VFI47_06465 [Acidimicrobiales bacterium]|nr:hypothetical protein [Acidimicrobiales bacterium]